MKSDYRVLFFCLALLCCLTAIFLAVDISVSTDNAQSENTQSDNLKTTGSAHQEQFYNQQSSAGEVQLVRFDPNTADSTTLLRLGLQPWMVRGIYKYRAKGGVYSSPEDFARVPGLTQKKYKELLPYISISPDYQPASKLVGERHYEHGGFAESTRDTSRTHYPKKMDASERLAITTADTTALKRVPGIGSYFARKLVDYRERLGGFVSLDQVLEIKNFPESALQYLTIPDGHIRKLNINKATFKQLSAHPYIGYSRTKVIVDYRRLKGNITSLNQLSLMSGFSQAEISRLEPYIEY